MDSGECIAAVIQKEPWREAQSLNPEAHCGKEMVGGALMTQGIAMPVQDSIETALSYVIARHITEGLYEELVQEWMEQSAFFPNTCAKSMDGAEGDEQEGFQSLGISHLLGPFMITFICTTGGLAAYLFFGYALEDAVALGRTANNLGGQANMATSDVKLKKGMKGRPFKELWDRAVAADVPQDELSPAIDAAPDKRLLIQAIFKHECSEVRRRLIGLQAHTFSELCRVAEAIGANRAFYEVAINHHKKPKQGERAFPYKIHTVCICMHTYICGILQGNAQR
jgi:hypothetical protein